MGDKLKGKVAIVTGSGQGIGKAIAVGLAQEGAKVVTNNRKPGTEGGDAETTVKEIKAAGGEALAFFGDVSKFAEAEKMVKATVEKFGTVDILVNNAGADAPRMVWNMAEEEWDRCVDSFLKGSFTSIRHVAPIMRERGWGRIISMTSDAWLGTVGHCNYGAAKAGIVGLTRAVARELGKFGVTCNAIVPVAGTRFTMAPDVVAGVKKRYESGLISKERFDDFMNIPGPECIAPLVNYLCTQEAGDINGQVLGSQGGEISIFSEPVRAKIIYKDFRKEGLWTVDELIKLVPMRFLLGYVNPAPAEKKTEKK